ncbi:HdeD family acid-resistance protein [Weissella viridescens]|uniref:HdeD family acid-resistance protein n=1 Tax=Weissella viridescens TaxID=1629 RepID=UPI001C7CCF65|nr:DUF308 domain-containing protein [Weissella viridescens]MBX4172024.1 DUF308 domain-containing protein [Weissella viridescens]MCB6840943.1 DUF308 domain-containing protein [Weissella viridescens]MCB6847669.1 DUF308 domain-containing protein [Weissella viridescens]WJI90902.1 DUF308 domain-containing protein [Weissella viridescens]
MNQSKGFDIFSLVLGILSLVLAFVVLKFPGGSLAAIVIVIGIFMIIDGILHFSQRGHLRSIGMKSTGMLTFLAILDIIVGLAIIIWPASFGAIYVWIFVAIGMVMDSLFELWAAKYIKQVGKGYYWFVVIMAIIGLILGIVMMFSPAFGLSFVVALLAAYLLVFGVMEIVKAF